MYQNNQKSSIMSNSKRFRKQGASLYEYSEKHGAYIHCYVGVGMTKKEMIENYLDNLNGYYEYY